MEQEDNNALGGYKIQFGSFGLVDEEGEEAEALQQQGNCSVSNLDSKPPPASPISSWASLFKSPSSTQLTTDEEQRKDVEYSSSLRLSSASHQIPLLNNKNNKSVLPGEGKPASDVVHSNTDEEEEKASIDELVRDTLVQLHVHPSYVTTAKLVRCVVFFCNSFGLDCSCWNRHLSVLAELLLDHACLF